VFGTRDYLVVVIFPERGEGKALLRGLTRASKPNELLLNERTIDLIYRLGRGLEPKLRELQTKVVPPNRSTQPTGIVQPTAHPARTRTHSLSASGQTRTDQTLTQTIERAAAGRTDERF
jgi:hypothetical protein